MDDSRSSEPFGIYFVKENGALLTDVVVVFYQQEAILKKPLFFTPVSLSRKVSGFVLYPWLGNTRLYLSRIPKRKFSVSDAYR